MSSSNDDSDLIAYNVTMNISNLSTSFKESRASGIGFLVSILLLFLFMHYLLYRKLEIKLEKKAKLNFFFSNIMKTLQNEVMPSTLVYVAFILTFSFQLSIIIFFIISIIGYAISILGNYYSNTAIKLVGRLVNYLSTLVAGIICIFQVYYGFNEFQINN